MKPLSFLIADDHELVRRGLRTLLETQPNWIVAGEASDGREAVEQALRLKPDLVIMDITMPELNGLDATRQILKSLPQTQVLILTMHESEHVVREVLASGARGYVLKSDAGRDLIAAAEALSQRRTFFTNKVSDMVLDGYLNRKLVDEAPTGKRLTVREREVVQLVAEGKSSKQISHVLNISIKTVEAHRSNIMKKLGLGSVGDLVRYAIRNNIIES
ncbi:MAG TPA: response regulator transcription factor [Bryobacteraceae bacterium]|nr:response regulator transcription factor [Bryobacteraceae bacterium]